MSATSTIPEVDIPLPAVGTGEVRGLIPVDAHAAVAIGRYGDNWAGAFKSFWVASPSYSGPFTVRGARVDGPGDIAFGANPQVITEIAVPAGPTQQVSAGYRIANEPTMVTTAGCYALEVDGVGFSDVIVFKAVAS